MRRSLSTMLGIALLGGGLIACSADPPTDKQALAACQQLALAKMTDAVGNPRFRSHKATIEAVESGPENYEFAVYGEYFYKAHYSGDSELRFNCNVAKTPEAEQWTTVSFDSRCIGGCS